MSDTMSDTGAIRPMMNKVSQYEYMRHNNCATAMYRLVATVHLPCRCSSELGYTAAR